jgi:hypothetical protein
LAALPQQAIAPLEKAISLDRSWAALRSRLGIALNGLNRHDEAFEHYRLGVEIDPLSAAIVNRYVYALAASGDAQEALKVTDTYLHRGGSEAHAWRFRGNALHLAGDLSGSLAARHRSLELDPQIPYQDEWLAIGLHLLGLKDQAVRHIPQISPYFQLFVADDRGALRTRVQRDGPRAWTANGIDSAVFSLARGRDWHLIARLYDVRPSDQRDLCVTRPRFAPFIAMALSELGRASEADRIISCVQRSISAEMKQRHRSPDGYPGELELWQASLLALRGDHRALDWLGKAVDRGWMGQYLSASLADWPQFDRLRGDPRYGAIQRRIDQRVARERAETLKLLAH